MSKKAVPTMLLLVLAAGLAACERNERSATPAADAPAVAPAVTPTPPPAGSEPEGYGTEVDPLVADTAPPPRPLAPEERNPGAPPSRP